MTYHFSGLRVGPRCWLGLATAVLTVSTTSCTVVQRGDIAASERLRETASLVEEVKAFGKTLGIEPTESLSRTTQDGPALSMLWLWMQRMGTLALRMPIDIRLAIGFATAKEQLKLEQVYRVEGYSVYYRQGNEFADDRALATAGFAAEGAVRRVKVILHEDLHGDKNFALPWEIEESVVTPLGSLAAVEFFRRKDDQENLNLAILSVDEERRLCRELNELALHAERIFQSEAPAQAKRKVLALMPSFPIYRRQFERQIQGQNPPTVVEAKLSHDLAYYRYFDSIADLFERAGDLKTLISDLKNLPHDATPEVTENYLQALSAQYGAVTK